MLFHSVIRDFSTLMVIAFFNRDMKPERRIAGKKNIRVTVSYYCCIFAGGYKESEAEHRQETDRCRKWQQDRDPSTGMSRTSIGERL